MIEYKLKYPFEISVNLGSQEGNKYIRIEKAFIKYVGTAGVSLLRKYRMLFSKTITQIREKQSQNLLDVASKIGEKGFSKLLESEREKTEAKISKESKESKEELRKREIIEQLGPSFYDILEMITNDLGKVGICEYINPINKEKKSIPMEADILEDMSVDDIEGISEEIFNHFLLLYWIQRNPS